MVKNKSFVLSIVCFIFLANSFTILSKSNKHKKDKKNKEYYKKDFYSFCSGLFNWASYLNGLKKEEEKNSDIYFKLKIEKIKKLANHFENHRDALYGMRKHDDLHMINNQELIPNDIYYFLRHNFGMDSEKTPINRNIILVKIIGGEFNFKNGSKFHVEGLLNFIENYNLNSWSPIKKFIHNFHDTLTLDSKLSAKLGRTMLPLVEHYYNYMDTVSRFKILKDLIESHKSSNFIGKKNHDTEQVAIKIFQSSGPILIKLLQELQEEVIGETPISNVLAALTTSKPMDSKKICKETKKELSNLTGKRKINDFRMREKPLGIASIAQTHLIEYNDQKYVVKVQKEFVDKIFFREQKFINKLVNMEPVFDKGMKQRINNTNEGIEEELNFNNERKNIIQGEKLYTEENGLIQTINLPKELSIVKSKGNSKVLIMSLAKGESLGKVMDRNSPDELMKAYSSMQEMYRAYLEVGLSSKKEKNFYHGDLHRENIFYDSNTDNLTMIDFGNAGKISSKTKQYLLEIYKQTKKTNLDSEDEEKLDNAIRLLSETLLNFVLDYNKKYFGNNALRKNLIRMYFKTCFDPENSIQNKIYQNKMLVSQMATLEQQKKQLQQNILQEPKNASDKDLEELQDDIDFIKALSNNCLNGPTNPLLSSLATHDFISNKLNVVFQELQKNGIAMPKEIIFFNKSNSLLQGILMNLAQMLKDNDLDFDFVEPDHIFIDIITKLNESSVLKER